MEPLSFNDVHTTFTRYATLKSGFQSAETQGHGEDLEY